jgi:antitoxin ParD1/3/4
MSTADLNLGKHWEQFLQSKLATGNYKSIGEVVREALRYMEERDRKLAELRTHLALGAEQAKKGQFDEGYSLGGLLNELDA